jgi:hypothetical protein
LRICGSSRSTGEEEGPGFLQCPLLHRLGLLSSASLGYFSLRRRSWPAAPRPPTIDTTDALAAGMVCCVPPGGAASRCTTSSSRATTSSTLPPMAGGGGRDRRTRCSSLGLPLPSRSLPRSFPPRSPPPPTSPSRGRPSPSTARRIAWRREVMQFCTPSLL